MDLVKKILGVTAGAILLCTLANNVNIDLRYSGKPSKQYVSGQFENNRRTLYDTNNDGIPDATIEMRVVEGGVLGTGAVAVLSERKPTNNEIEFYKTN